MSASLVGSEMCIRDSKSARTGGASSAAGVSVGASRAARVCGLPVLSSAATVTSRAARRAC
eukprot:2339097-Alexandrium_andersonii.AAC.1